MKKLFLLLIPLTFLFSGCWIEPHYGNYTQVGDTVYYEDWDTMVSLTVAKINKSFSNWHWSKKEFYTKYNYYLDNIEKNEDDYNYLQSSNYQYAVKNANSRQQVKLKSGTIIYNEYFWITTKDGASVVFFMN